MRRRNTDVRPARLAAAVVLLAVLAGCAAGAKPVAASAASAARKASPSRTRQPAAGRPAQRRPAPAATRNPQRTPPSALPVAPASAADEPQTTAFPKTADPAFAAEEHDIWLAVTTGDPDYARLAFFPEQAYAQVKAITDPESDWANRLWYDFTLDVAAAHQLLKPGATLVAIEVPTQYAQWIPPGACYNTVGYWHVPGSRIVYRQAGTTLSFGVASFISWRGNWYVVHLGAVTRASAYGIVDNPARGAGTPGPPGGC